MKLEPAWVPGTALPEQAPASFQGWPFAAALVLGTIFWLIAWYGDTAQSVVAIWQRSDTFAHGFVIVPISAWLIWRRRHALAALDPRPNFLALLLLALVGFGWLLGQLAGAGVVQQYALVLMIPLLVWSILGNQVVWALAFPLFFLLFAVPFGEFLEPPLMEHTADFTVAALRLTGIPVYREGQFFTVPSGSWSVVEACSGLRYLIASLTLGFLYAYLTYRSLSRRAIFVACSIIVPIVANWFRAYMIVMIGHLSGMQYAVGVDHLIYGWLFFGVVMLILFWVGTFWREDVETQGAVLRPVGRAQPNFPSLGATLAAAIAAAVTAAFWPFAAARLEDTGSLSSLVLQAPPPAGGWHPLGGHLTGWTPRFSNSQFQLKQTYGKDSSRAGVFIGYYRQQRQGAQLISSQNMLVSSNDGVWRNAGEMRRTLTFGRDEVPAVEAKLRSASENLLVWRWYWIDGQFVVNPYWAKLLQAKSKLSGRGDDGAVVIVYAPFMNQPAPAEKALQEFVGAMLPALTTSLENARRTGQ